MHSHKCAEVSDEDVTLMLMYREEMSRTHNNVTPEIAAWVNEVTYVYSKAAWDKIEKEFPRY